MNQSKGNDQLQRFIFDDMAIRGAWICLDQTLLDCYEHQQAYPQILKNQLNQCLAASALLSANIKQSGLLSIQAKGNHCLQLLMAESRFIDHHSPINIRGVMRIDEQAQSNNENNLAQLLGKGMLGVSIEPDEGLRYQGIVELKGEQLSDYLSNYFEQSEQLNTHFHFANDDNRVVGLMIQRLPGEEITKENHEQAQLDWEHCLQLCLTLSDEELLEADAQTILYRLFHQEALRIFESQALTFQCRCSREGTDRALLSLGQNEVMHMLSDIDPIEMDCELCGKHYRYGLDEITDLFGIDHSSSIN